MADKVPNNDASSIPTASNIVPGLTPSASDPGPVMPSSAINTILTNPLAAQNQTAPSNQTASTTVNTSLPINSLQNVSGNRFSEALYSNSTYRYFRKVNDTSQIHPDFYLRKNSIRY